MLWKYEKNWNRMQANEWKLVQVLGHEGRDMWEGRQSGGQLHLAPIDEVRFHKTNKLQ